VVTISTSKMATGIMAMLTTVATLVPALVLFILHIEEKSTTVFSPDNPMGQTLGIAFILSYGFAIIAIFIAGLYRTIEEAV